MHSVLKLVFCLVFTWMPQLAFPFLKDLFYLGFPSRYCSQLGLTFGSVVSGKYADLCISTFETLPTPVMTLSNLDNTNSCFTNEATRPFSNKTRRNFLLGKFELFWCAPARIASLRFLLHIMFSNCLICPWDSFSFIANVADGQANSCGLHLPQFFFEPSHTTPVIKSLFTCDLSHCPIYWETEPNLMPKYFTSSCKSVVEPLLNLYVHFVYS